jgi:hypothetical protein
MVRAGSRLTPNIKNCFHQPNKQLSPQAQTNKDNAKTFILYGHFQTLEKTHRGHVKMLDV